MQILHFYYGVKKYMVVGIREKKKKRKTAKRHERKGVKKYVICVL